MNAVRSHNQSLKPPRFTPTGCKFTLTGCKFTHTGCKFTHTGCKFTPTGCKLSFGQKNKNSFC